MPFIMLAVLIDMAAIGVIIPVLPVLVASFSANQADQAYWYGVVAVAFGMANFLGSPLLGALSDRSGRRPVLLLGFMGLGISFFGIALTDTLWGLIVVRTLGGVMQGNIAIANAYVADISSPEQRAKRFALLKTLNILFNIVGNLFFIGLCKWAYDTNATGWLAWSAQFYDPDIGIGYVFIANLIASGLTILLLLPEFIEGLGWPDLPLWKRMLVYALPLLVAGLAGMVNETMSRILLKYMLPIETAMEALGVYGACYKMSILMTLFIQSFRYAAEPFFSYYKQSDARDLYALVMRWFVIACSLIFLGVMANIAWVQYFVGANYRSGLGVVPILLMANLCLGVFFNLSIWYKLTEQTRFGTYLTLWGSAVTLTLNFYWIPRYGFMGSAWGTLACYASMAVWSYLLGQKFYKIPYDLGRMIAYPLLAVAIFLWGEKIEGLSVALELAAKNGLVLGFVGVVFVLERKKA